MKNRKHGCLKAAILTCLLTTASLASAQSTTTTTTSSTQSDGTVSQFSPDTIVVRSTTSTSPLSYSYSKTTTYVDENGNTVSSETVKSGAPVTVYYTRDGDRMVATKVVVRKTTTATTDPAVQPAVAPATPPTADGVIAEADSRDIAITTGASESRVHYKAHDATAYVDENNNPVSRHSLKKGTPVTIYFERDGDSLLATRVVVRNPATVEKTTTTVVTPVSQ